jgi:galactonate dehydratase
MKISKIETMHCDAGWRPWSFIKISTDEGLHGWSECTDSHGSPRGIEGVITDLTPLIVGHDPRETEKIYWELYSHTRQSPGSVIQKAIGGIENALLDIKAKALGVPVYELFGGPVRERIPLYWSHCGTTRVRAWQSVNKNQIKSFDDLRAFGDEILKSGYRAIKTNIAIFDENPRIYMPGFNKSEGGPELNPTRAVLEAVEKYIRTFRETVGKSVDIILDLNFNFKTEGYIKIGQILEPFNLLWLEMDIYDAVALHQVRNSIRIPVCSGENLYGARAYRPYFENNAVDIASIDIIWNGYAQSKKISDLAELYEVNVTPHNYYSHLATFISAQYCAAIPNLRIMEIDVDDVPWKDELVTELPDIKQGNLEIPKKPGWGTKINEDVLRKHPWPK